MKLQHEQILKAHQKDLIKLDNSGEISNTLFYSSTDGLIKKEYEQIPAVIKTDISN